MSTTPPREPDDAGREGGAAMPSLAVWEFAGLMLTYWCSSRCAICYVHGGPKQGGDMSVERAVSLWRGLDNLALAHGATMRIHLAGGEPFGDWVRLVSIIRAARDAGLSPLEKVETNASWATSVNLARARLELLDALGMDRLIVSADVFHQQFVPFERVRNCVTAARHVLGKGRLIVRWWDFFNDPVDSAAMSPEERRDAFARALQQHPDRLAGRAADELADLLPLQPPEAFAGMSCTHEVLQSRHVHIDPDGHVFPGTCGGIILGRVDAGDDVAALWKHLAAKWRDHPVVDAVVSGGSYELMQRAEAMGYTPRPEGYAGKCHLCAHVRRYLVQHGHWPEFVGPPACYGLDDDADEEAGEWRIASSE